MCCAIITGCHHFPTIWAEGGAEHLSRVFHGRADWRYVEPEEAYDLEYKLSTFAILKEGCRRVVQFGTAARINDDKVRMAGKTGTAQNPHGNEHAWFAGWAPYENPQIAVCALVENAGHGSTYAAPICFEIAKQYLYPPPPDTAQPAPVDTLQVEPGAPTASIRQ